MRLRVLLQILGLLQQILAADLARVVHLPRHRFAILKLKIINIYQKCHFCLKYTNQCLLKGFFFILARFLTLKKRLNNNLNNNPILCLNDALKKTIPFYGIFYFS